MRCCMFFFFILLLTIENSGLSQTPQSLCGQVMVNMNSPKLVDKDTFSKLTNGYQSLQFDSLQTQTNHLLCVGTGDSLLPILGNIDQHRLSETYSVFAIKDSSGQVHLIDSAQSGLTILQAPQKALKSYPNQFTPNRAVNKLSDSTFRENICSRFHLALKLSPFIETT